MSAIHTPDWVKDAVFYQILPDRFAKSPSLNGAKPHNLEPWDAPPTAHGYKGGDLLGVLEKLDHIQDLGATALYFCPIFQSASNHRYHTHDYYRVDPMLGGNEAFLALLSEAHRRGMKIVLDGVFNHASRGFFPFSDILENGRSSAYLDWFTVRDFPPNAYDHSRPAGYEAWWGLHALPKLNTDNPQVREYLMRVAEHWLRLGIDGWRLDVPLDIRTEGFWQEFRQRVKAVNPEAYIVAEIWHPAVSWLQGDQFDAVMNYPFAEAAIAFAGQGRVNPKLAEGKSYQPDMKLDAKGYADRIDWLLDLYPWEVQQAQLNLLASHDTARAISLAGGDIATVHLATLLLMTFPGAPCIFYGDEVGMEGGVPDADTRRTFPWDRPHLWKNDVLSFHKELIALRQAHPALRRGKYHRLYADADVYAFGRELNGEALLVAVNVAESERIADIPIAGLGARAKLRVLYPSAPQAAVAAKQDRERALGLTLGPRSGIVLGL